MSNEKDWSQKGSVSMDFVFASLLFILLLGFTVVAYQGYVDTYLKDESKRNLESNVLSISEILVKSKGYPSSWETNPAGVVVPGLASSENILDNDKVIALGNLSYNSTKQLFGLNKELFISIKTLDGTLVFSKGTEQENMSSVAIERLVYFNRTACRLKVRIYD